MLVCEDYYRSSGLARVHKPLHVDSARLNNLLKEWKGGYKLFSREFESFRRRFNGMF